MVFRLPDNVCCTEIFIQSFTKKKLLHNGTKILTTESNTFSSLVLTVAKSPLAQSPSLLPDGFKVLQAQPIRCDFSKLDYKLCYSEILVNCSNSCIHCKLQSVSVTEKSCFQSCPYSCPSVVAINRLIRLYCRCI